MQISQWSAAMRRINDAIYEALQFILHKPGSCTHEPIASNVPHAHSLYSAPFSNLRLSTTTKSRQQGTNKPNVRTYPKDHTQAHSPRNPQVTPNQHKQTACTTKQPTSPLYRRREKTIHSHLAATIKKRLRTTFNIISSHNSTFYNNDASDRKAYDALAQTYKDTDDANKGKYSHLINETNWTICYKKFSNSFFANQDEYQETMRAIIFSIFDERHTIRTKISKVISWNTGGLAEEGKRFDENFATGRLRKIINRVHIKGIMMWQETGMDDRTARKIQQSDPNIAIVHTPPHDGAKYGSAILWSRHRFGDFAWVRVIVPGCIVAVGLNTIEGEVTLISTYIPIHKTRETSEILKAFLKTIKDHEIVFIGGDFNFGSGDKGYEEAVHLVMTDDRLTPSHGRANSRGTFRIGAKETYLDEIFIRHPELNNGGAIVKSNTYFNYEGTQEHAQLSVQLTKVSYPDQQDYHLFEKTCLDKLHPTAVEAIIIVENVTQDVYGPHPTQVQKQIAGIAAAQDIRMKASGWLKRNDNAYNFRDTWRSLRRRHRAAKSAYIYASTAAIDDLNKASRSITNTQGVHDIIPYTKPDTDDPSPPIRYSSR